MKKILIILAVVGLVFLVGMCGELDQDEYIEVNLTPKTQMWRGN